MTVEFAILWVIWYVMTNGVLYLINSPIRMGLYNKEDEERGRNL